MGDAGDQLYVIVEGEVVLRMPMTILGETRDVTLETLETGQAVGWSALVPPHKLTMTAMTRRDSVLITLVRADLLAIFAGEPRIGWKMMTNLAGVIGHRLVVTQAIMLRQLQNSLDQGIGPART